METCNAVGCFEPRHKSTGGYLYSYCYKHWIEQMESRKREVYEGEEQPIMTEPLCVVEGCDQARMRNGQGEMLTMCPEHQRAYWREQAAKRKPKAKATRNPKPDTSPSGTVIATLFGKAVEVMPPNTVVGSNEVSEAFKRSATEMIPVRHDCDGCEAKTVIEALRAKSPKLAKLIDAVQAEVEATRELGL